MNRQELEREKIYIKMNIKKVLKFYGVIETNTNWHCLVSRHKNNKNKMTVKNNYCCCHCGIKGDSFNVIAELEGLTDFTTIYNRAKDILGLSSNDIAKFVPNKKELEKEESEKKENQIKLRKNLIELNENLKKYLEKNNSNYNYFIKRGITSPQLLKKMIVINPEDVIPSFFYSEKIKNLGLYENIIPIWEHGKIVNCILRKNDLLNNAKYNNLKILNLKAPLKIYNSDLIRNELKGIVYITEGIFDALTFENEGKKAISINSITMINRLFDIININKNKYKGVIFVIAFDFDKNGKRNYGYEAAKELQKKLKEINIISKILKINQYNDINEYYVKDKKTFVKKLNIIENHLNKIKFDI